MTLTQLEKSLILLMVFTAIVLVFTARDYCVIPILIAFVIGLRDIVRTRLLEKPRDLG